MEINKILLGDCLLSLKTLPDNSVDCCVTSPPYYALRDYGTGHWEGGDPNCPHYRTNKASDKTATGHKRMQEFGSPVGDAIYKDVCPLCGAVRVDEQIGLEETPEAYIAKLTEVFEQVRRVLKPEGTLWLNIGDSYWGGGWRCADINEHSGDIQKGSKGTHCGLSMPALKGANETYKPKDLIGIPWMLAFSLRNAGWYLRQDIIWHKPNPMPESVTDRCTKSHEYIFLLSKSQMYYFDHEAIQEEAVSFNPDRTDGHRICGNKYSQGLYKPELKTEEDCILQKEQRTQEQGYAQAGGHRDNSGGLWKNHRHTKTKNCQYDGQEPNSMHLRREAGLPDELHIVRNKRDVWCVNLKPNNESHFATYPEKLIQPCILAGCPEDGVVLDPFMGSGTTGIVARKLNRNYIGCELNPEYKAMAERRIAEYGEGLFNQE